MNPGSISWAFSALRTDSPEQKEKHDAQCYLSHDQNVSKAATVSDPERTFKRAGQIRLGALKRRRQSADQACNQ